jgi:hypothetical protein
MAIASTVILPFSLLEVKFNLTLKPTVNRPVCPGTRPQSRTHDQYFFHFHGKYFQIFEGFFLWSALTDESTGL